MTIFDIQKESKIFHQEAKFLLKHANFGPESKFWSSIFFTNIV